MPKLTTLLFDVDGTLAETEEIHRQSFNRAFEQAGLDWEWSPQMYSELLAEVQGFLPKQIHIVLGDRTEQSYRLANYYRYYHKIKARFLEEVNRTPGATYPMPCAHCDLCDWRELCKQQWQQDDHLVQVANISCSQIEKKSSRILDSPRSGRIVAAHFQSRFRNSFLMFTAQEIALQ